MMPPRSGVALQFGVVFWFCFFRFLLLGIIKYDTRSPPSADAPQPVSLVLLLLHQLQALPQLDKLSVDRLGVLWALVDEPLGYFLGEKNNNTETHQQRFQD